MNDAFNVKLYCLNDFELVCNARAVTRTVVVIQMKIAQHEETSRVECHDGFFAWWLYRYIASLKFCAVLRVLPVIKSAP
jgi:hypothetical protein